MNIWRFMVDRRYQENGCGREVLKRAIDFVRSAPCGKPECCCLSYAILPSLGIFFVPAVVKLQSVKNASDPGCWGPEA